MNLEKCFPISNASMQTPNILLQHNKEKKPRNEDKPTASSSSFATQEKPTQDDNELPSSLSSCVMQEKKTKGNDKACSSLSSTLLL
jgi:hypothetical protein